MKAAKYILVVLSLTLLAGCVFPIEESGPDSYGPGEFQYDGRGWDGGEQNRSEQDRSDDVYRGY